MRGGKDGQTLPKGVRQLEESRADFELANDTLLRANIFTTAEIKI